MCMIVGEVPVHISDTNIYVGKTIDGTKQFTVYKNKVEYERSRNPSYEMTREQIRERFLKGELSPNPNTETRPMAMVLPVPFVKGNKEIIEVVAMDGKYHNIFDKLRLLFPNLSWRGQSFGGERFADSRNAAPPPIEVLKVGSYDVSVVESLDDFGRLQNDVFALDPNFSSLLKREYSKGFGFVVCRLQNGAKYHPIAYVHPLREDGKLFVPTKHYHNGSESHADWDHEIYILNGNVDPNCRYNGIGHRERGYSHVATPIAEAKGNTLTQLKIGDSYKMNHDLIVHVH